MDATPLDARFDEPTSSRRRLHRQRGTRGRSPSADRGGWRPLWLSRTVLLAFIALFLLLAAGLGAIYLVVLHEQGFSLSVTNNHYSWTYGPTVILVCVVGLWRRVNYCTMINQPWHELSRESPQDAATTVLLDYMWPLQVSSLWASLKRGHPAVSASILVFALLKVIIVISTTLFLPGEAFIHRQVQLSLESSFDPTTFWNATPTGSYFIENATIPNIYLIGAADRVSYSNISADPVWAYVNLRNEYSSDPPIELSTAFTGFSIQSQAPGRGVKLAADVDVFQPNTICEVVNIDWPRDIVETTVNLTMRTSSCNIGQIELPTCLLGEDCPEKVNYFLVERVNCMGEGMGFSTILDETTPNTYQYAMIVVEMDSVTAVRTVDIYEATTQPFPTGSPTVSVFQPDLPGPTDSAGDSAETTDSLVGIEPTGSVGVIGPFAQTDPSDAPGIVKRLILGIPGDDGKYPVFEGRAVRVAAVSCSLSYTISRAVASASGPDMNQVYALDTTTISHQVGPSSIPNFSSLQVSEAVFSTLQTAGGIFNHSELARDGLGGRTLLGLIGGLTASGSSVPDFEPLFNVENLRARTQEVLNGVSQQLMRHYFLLPYQDSQTALFQGSIEYSEPRLLVRPLALWTMLGLFVACASLVIVLVLCAKRGVAPPSPATLATSLSTLASSPDMVNLLSGASGGRARQIRERLTGWSFSAVPDGGSAVFRIQASEKPPPGGKGALSRAKGLIRKGARGARARATTRSKSASWVPYPARRHAVAIILFLPLACIAALEALWYFSRTDANFVTPSSDSSVVVYAVRYSSTAVLPGIATLFNAMDFAIATLTPFSALAFKGEQGASGERTLLFSMVADLPPVALYKAVRNGHAGAALSLAASTTGSLLTIAVSSLWVLNTVPRSQEATAQMRTGWAVDFEAAYKIANSSSHGGVDVFNDVQHGSSEGGGLVLLDSNIVIPDIDVDSPSDALPLTLERWNNHAASDSYVFPIPAVQPTLECSAIPQSSIVLREKDHILTTSMSIITAIAPVPDGCELASGAANTSDIEIAFDIYQQRSGSPIAVPGELHWLGLIKDLDVRPASGSDRGPSSRGCPSLGVMFGHFGDAQGDIGETFFDYQVVSYICTQRLKAVEANVTYQRVSPDATALMPNLTIPVRLHDGSESLVDPRSNVSSLSFAVADHFNFHTTTFLAEQRHYFDNFFEHLTTGPEKTPHERMFDEKVLMGAVKALYQKFMAYVIDVDFRVPLDRPGPPEDREMGRMQPILDDGVVLGTFTETVFRLEMSETSKIILEALLGAMVLFGGLAFGLVRVRGVLPRNPYPIASDMALFEGSRFLRELDREEEEEETAQVGRDEQWSGGGETSKMSGRDMARIVTGRRFRLGWWDGKTVRDSSVRGSEEDSLMSAKRFGIDLVEDSE